MWACVLPVLVLMTLLFSAVSLFGPDSSYGPNQIALLASALVAAGLAMSFGYSWKHLEAGIVQGISHSLGAILILLVVGALIGSWILCGTVPTLISYGLSLLHPQLFYVAACLIASVVSLATGSSWTTVGTVGIALIGVGHSMGLSDAICAGAIISGAYFGDKLSPLSDTTNLAPAMAGTELFTHIRHMLWTTLPSYALSLVIFLLLGFRHGSQTDPQALQDMQHLLSTHFSLGLFGLLPPMLVFVLVLKKVPAFLALWSGVAIACLLAFFFQEQVVLKQANAPELLPVLAKIKGIWMVLFGPFQANTGSAALDSLLSRGGMASMLNTIWLILSAMVFGAVLECTGMLERLAASVLKQVHSTGALISATLATSIGMNIIASDQYIAIVLPGRMFQAEFRRRRLAPENLSRCLEDAGTLTSPLVPWNTCGAFMSQNLAVATFSYLPFCFFNLLNPLISSLWGWTGFTIKPLDVEPEEPVQNIDLKTYAE
jgi:NhaC family Na+:H+ antiporter